MGKHKGAEVYHGDICCLILPTFLANSVYTKHAYICIHAHVLERCMSTGQNRELCCLRLFVCGKHLKTVCVRAWCTHTHTPIHSILEHLLLSRYPQRQAEKHSNWGKHAQDHCELSGTEAFIVHETKNTHLVASVNSHVNVIAI